MAVCKVRGITLNYNASQMLNFVVIRKMILGKTEMGQMSVHTEKKIKRNRKVGGAQFL